LGVEGEEKEGMGCPTRPLECKNSFGGEKIIPEERGRQGAKLKKPTVQNQENEKEKLREERRGNYPSCWRDSNEAERAERRPPP